MASPNALGASGASAHPRFPSRRKDSNMGKSAPAAPDPYATSDAQAAANLKAIKDSARINALDQFAPWGSTTYARDNEGVPTAQRI
jgi:hypothetical protein